MTDKRRAGENPEAYGLVYKLLDRPITDYDTASNLFDMARNLHSPKLGRVAFERCAVAQRMITKKMQATHNHEKQGDRKQSVEDFRTLYNNVMDWLALYYFDEYMMALERNRPARERFYLPRRRQLLPIVDALQMLADGELDELFLSQPPRTGKTTLMLFFETWIAGRNPESANLYCSFASSVAGAFYDGVLEIVSDPETYRWNEIFTTGKVVDTSAKDMMVDFGRAKRYKTISCRSIEGGLNGLIDVSEDGILTADDLLSGIEEAMNADILQARWAKVKNNMLARRKKGSRVVWEGTRWSLKDPIGRRLEELESDPDLDYIRFMVLNVPALDENDESNFDYLYGVGFDTQHFRGIRAGFESSNMAADWLAQFQGEPIERLGSLFAADQLNYYYGDLPGDAIPDKTVMFIDVAWGGGDFLSAPIGKRFGDRKVVDAVIYDKGDKYVTRPRVVKAIIEHKVNEVVIEANNGGNEYAEWISEELRRLGVFDVIVRTRRAPSNKRKEDRIYARAPEIREFEFRAAGNRDNDYRAFMRDLTSYTINGKNKNDDAPDSMSGLVEAMRGRGTAKFEVHKRPF